MPFLARAAIDALRFFDVSARMKPRAGGDVSNMALLLTGGGSEE